MLFCENGSLENSMPPLIGGDYKENGYHKNVAPPIKGGIEFSSDPFSQKSMLREDFVNHKKPRSAIRREIDNIQPSGDKFEDSTESKLYVQHKQLPLIAKTTRNREAPFEEKLIIFN